MLIARMDAEILGQFIMKQHICDSPFYAQLHESIKFMNIFKFNERSFDDA